MIDPGLLIFATVFIGATIIGILIDRPALLKERRVILRRPSASPRWWPFLLLGIAPVAALATQALAPTPDGHWREHLVTAGLGVGQFGAVAVGVFLARKHYGLAAVAVLVVLFGIAVQTSGNLQVADSIWKTSGDPGATAAPPSGYESGHDAAGGGDGLVLLGALAFVLVAAATHHIRWRTAGAVAGLCIVPPPFFWPAYGLLAHVVYRLAEPRASDSLG